jgi:predicted deacylase
VLSVPFRFAPLLLLMPLLLAQPLFADDPAPPPAPAALEPEGAAATAPATAAIAEPEVAPAGSDGEVGAEGSGRGEAAGAPVTAEPLQTEAPAEAPTEATGEAPVQSGPKSTAGDVADPDSGAETGTDAAAESETAAEPDTASGSAAEEEEGPAADTGNAPPAADTEPDAGAATGDAPHRAENIDLKEVVPVPVLVQPAPQPAATEPGPAPTPTPASDGQPLILLGSEVAPGTATRLGWSPRESFAGIAAPTPVLVVNGARRGPVLCLTAAIHGDELVGIEVVRRLLYDVDPQQLNGALIGVPIVNLQGFRRSSRYLPDRRDLNRFFPGNPNASSAARIAHSFFNEVVVKCDALVDIHTGSFHRTNLPQVRADLGNPEVAALSRGFGATVVLQSRGARNTLRRAAVEAGIPAVTLEAGEPLRLDEEAVGHGVKSIQSLLDSLGMLKTRSIWSRKAEPIYYKSAWVRANQGGILMSQVQLGARVRAGDLLGTVTDPITNVRNEITSPYDGRVIGMALNQVMMPGFAAYHIGIQATPEEAAEDDSEEDDGIDDQEDEESPATAEPEPEPTDTE